MSGATVRRGITNTGTINSKLDGVAIDVSAATPPVSIANTGTINGIVRLGSGTLDINGGNHTSPHFLRSRFVNSGCKPGGWGGVVLPEGDSTSLFEDCIRPDARTDLHLAG